jgi:hypothetical protein
MNDYTTNQKLEVDESDSDDMLDEYDFSNAKPSRYREFKGNLIRVLNDGTEQLIEPKAKDDYLKNPIKDRHTH